MPTKKTWSKLGMVDDGGSYCFTNLNVSILLARLQRLQVIHLSLCASALGSRCARRLCTSSNRIRKTVLKLTKAPVNDAQCPGDFKIFPRAYRKGWVHWE